jgi:hypothetical protein
MTDTYGYPSHPSGFDGGSGDYDPADYDADGNYVGPAVAAGGGEPPEEPWQPRPGSAHDNDVPDVRICVVCGQPIDDGQMWDEIGHGNLNDDAFCGRRAHSACDAIGRDCTCGAGQITTMTTHQN